MIGRKLMELNRKQKSFEEECEDNVLESDQ